MSYARAKRRYMQWERYVQKTGTRSRHKFHLGHANAWDRCIRTGRAFPAGVRNSPWMLIK